MQHRICINYLAGGLEHEFYFPDIGNFIIPTDFHILQRGRAAIRRLKLQWKDPWENRVPQKIDGPSVSQKGKCRSEHLWTLDIWIYSIC